jgi:hypothetical protein
MSEAGLPGLAAELKVFEGRKPTCLFCVEYNEPGGYCRLVAGEVC